MAETTIERPQPSVAYRWAVLIFISLAMFGNYYIYDSIAPVGDLMKSQLGFTDENIGLLYSIYSWAAVAVLFFSGLLIDKIGTKKSTMLFAVICLVAGVLTAVSSEFWVMLLGRLLLGIGAEPLIVAITTALAKWFKGKELSFAFGINLTIARLGSLGADYSPRWGKAYYDNWQDPLWIAAAIGSMCVVGGVVYWILEAGAEKRYALGEAGTTDKLNFKDLVTFDKSYWYIVALCVTFYSAIFPFRSFAIIFFQGGHGMTRDNAGILNGMLPLAAMIATPLFGIIVDKVGNRALFMAFGSLLLMPVYLMMAYGTSGAAITFDLPGIDPVTVPTIVLIAMFMMGVAFSLIPAVMWPSVAYIVQQNRLGTAYALMTLIQQVGLAAMNWIIGRANEAQKASESNPEGYALGMWVFTALSFAGLLFSYLLWRTEKGPNAHGLETIKAG
jgi:MFS family permease